MSEHALRHQFAVHDITIDHGLEDRIAKVHYDYVDFGSEAGGLHQSLKKLMKLLAAGQI